MSVSPEDLTRDERIEYLWSLLLDCASDYNLDGAEAVIEELRDLELEDEA